MTNESATIVQRLWNYCNMLRDDGVSYGDYVEQLTYLLFLKMAQEQAEFQRTLTESRATYSATRTAVIPERYAWTSLQPLDGGELENQYREILVELGKEKDMLALEIIENLQAALMQFNSISEMLGEEGE